LHVSIIDSGSERVNLFFKVPNQKSKVHIKQQIPNHVAVYQETVPKLLKRKAKSSEKVLYNESP